MAHHEEHHKSSSHSENEEHHSSFTRPIGDNAAGVDYNGPTGQRNYLTGPEGTPAYAQSGSSEGGSAYGGGSGSGIGSHGPSTGSDFNGSAGSDQSSAFGGAPDFSTGGTNYGSGAPNSGYGDNSSQPSGQSYQQGSGGDGIGSQSHQGRPAVAFSDGNSQPLDSSGAASGLGGHSHSHQQGHAHPSSAYGQGAGYTKGSGYGTDGAAPDAGLAGGQTGHGYDSGSGGQQGIDTTPGTYSNAGANTRDSGYTPEYSELNAGSQHPTQTHAGTNNGLGSGNVPNLGDSRYGSNNTGTGYGEDTGGSLGNNGTAADTGYNSRTSAGTGYDNNDERPIIEKGSTGEGYQERQRAGPYKSDSRTTTFEQSETSAHPTDGVTHTQSAASSQHYSPGEAMANMSLGQKMAAMIPGTQAHREKNAGLQE